MNRAYLDLIGYSEAELRTISWATDLTPPEWREREEATLAAVRSDGQPRTYEKEYIRKDGSRVPVEIRVHYHRPSDAAPGEAYYYAFLTDISDRKQVEATLRESEHRFRQMADTVSHMIWLSGRDGRHEWFNHRWWDFTGIADRGTPETDWSACFHPDDREPARQGWLQSLESGEPYEAECRLRHRSGEFRWVLVRAVPIQDPTGSVERWVGTCTDIHAMRMLAAEREKLLSSEQVAREKAEQESRLKDEFLATLSHELRTPLNAILGWAQLILRRTVATPEALREGLEVIQRNARTQSRLIEDLLDMSRIINGKVRLDVQRVDLAEVVDAAFATVQPAADARGVRLRKVLDPLAGPVVGDPSRLQQVVWNLLSNAVKFTPSGGRVEVLLERVNSHLEITVSDSGEGIDPLFLPHVFDRFRQADASTNRQHGGLGLGLSIVKSLVELHGGSVRAKSPGRGKGASFSVAIPLAAVDSGPQHGGGSRRHPSAEPGASVGGERMPRLDEVKVLVVDDDNDASNLMRTILEESGAQVTTACSAAEGVPLIAKLRPHVLVSDVGMPGEDGYDFIRRVRLLSAAEGGQTPAVALTAFARSEDRRRAIAAGFHFHMAKPAEPDELITVIASLAGVLSPKSMP